MGIAATIHRAECPSVSKCLLFDQTAILIVPYSLAVQKACHNIPLVIRIVAAIIHTQILTGSPADSRHVQKNITLPDTNSHDSFTIVHSDTFIIDVKEISPAQVATLGGFNSGDIHDFKHRWIHLLILLVNRSAQWNGDNLVISTVLRT